MSIFVFDESIFKSKFIKGNKISNTAKNKESSECDSICPAGSDNANMYKGYAASELLADALHNVYGSAVPNKKNIEVGSALKDKMLEEIDCQDNDDLKSVFSELIDTLYFESPNNSHSSSASLLKYLPSSKQSDFGKLVYDVLFDEDTVKALKGVIQEESNPLDDIVSSAYSQLNYMQKLPEGKKYARVFGHDLNGLFETMNRDFRAAIDNSSNSMDELEFLIAYYLFIYLSQFALRIDNNLENDTINEKQMFPLFKGAKEGVSEDRECIVNGWRRIEKKTQKIFKHLIVLNMLNCHTNQYPYLIYSDLYELYAKQPEERAQMDYAVDYIIDQYTVKYSHDTDVEGQNVDFSTVPRNESDDCVENFRNKVKYLFDCVSFQLDSKSSRSSVVSNVAGNYNHILKMRFVKSWGSLGLMMMFTNEDLINLISICESTSPLVVPDRGIQISDLFIEFQNRGLYMDGKTKQFVIDYLLEINLIDSKCDSEEAQYVKFIQ